MLRRVLVMLIFVLGIRLPIEVAGSPWPLRLNRHELILDRDSIGNASVPVHQETGTQGCSIEAIECVLMNEGAPSSVYYGCGVFLQPTDDGWCRLPLTSDDSKKYEQDICCGKDFADCCKLKVESMVGIAALSFALAVIASWAMFCCKDKLCQDRWCKLGRCACPLHLGKKIEQEDPTKTKGSEEFVPQTHMVPEGDYSLAKLLAKEAKRRRKEATKKIDKMKAYLARPRSPTKRMYVKPEDSAASEEGQIPPSLTSAVVVRGLTDDTESQAPVHSFATAPSLSSGKSIFVATTAPTPKEIEPIRPKGALKVELCWDHLELEEL